MFNRRKIKELEKRVTELEMQFGLTVGSQYDIKDFNLCDWGREEIKNNRINLVNLVRTIWEKINH